MRVKRGNFLRKRHKKILKLAKGFIGARSRIFKVANCAVMHALALDCTYQRCSSLYGFKLF